MDIIRTIKILNDELCLFRKGDRLLVGVSGGPDSMALLNILYALRYAWGVDLRVAHVNHQLRKDSQTDQKFVERTCRELKLPFHTVTLKKRKEGTAGSTEDWARRQRIEFFLSVVKKTKAEAVVLAHTRDDLAETILMKIVRGAGLMGARGILPKRTIEGIPFIRPLLTVSRQEIEIFLKKNKIPSRQDPTNRSLEFFRNKIRLKLLPYIEAEFNPKIKSSLGRLSEILTEDYDFIENAGKENLQRLAVSTSADRIVLDLKKFQKLHPSLRRMVLRLGVEELQGNKNRFGFTHIGEVESMVLRRPSGSIVDFPGGISVQKKENRLFLIRRKS